MQFWGYPKMKSLLCERRIGPKINQFTQLRMEKNEDRERIQYFSDQMEKISRE